MARPLIFLCLANYVKGQPFLEECSRLGVHTVLLAKEELQDKSWPESIGEKFFFPDFSRREELLKAVSFLARDREFDAVIPLDDYAVEVAAGVREHLRVPGMGESTARYFRDKLAMRLRARERGLLVPDFVHALNHRRIDRFAREVPAPWLVKPRSEAGSVQISKCHAAEDLWQAVESLGERQSFFLVERYIKGSVFHVDSIVYDDKVVFAAGHRYGSPPFDVWNGGGIFSSQSVPVEDPLYEALMETNREAVAAMGLPRGITHAEFILGDHDRRFYFLELAGRVGGAFIDVLVESQSGLNLWREWARLEAAHCRHESYHPIPSRQAHAGILLCLSRQERPDLSGYTADEVVWTHQEGHHAGLVVCSQDAGTVDHLMQHYGQRVAEEILAVAPPTAKPA